MCRAVRGVLGGWLTLAAAADAALTWQEALDLLGALGDHAETATVRALLRDVEPALPSA